MSEKPGTHNSDITQTSTGKTHLLAEGSLLAGRYRIGDVLGLGGMGMVYKAHDETLNIDVALKVLRDDRDSDAGERTLERFHQELVLARQVSHRNVVRIHDLGKDDEIYFLTMDLVEGRSLKELIEDQGSIPIARALDITRQLALGLNAAHEMGVVHRDLKPANILIDAKNTPYITDFGVARSATSTNLTRTGHIVGTPDYLSPEQARGNKLDGRSDIYSLGLMLYEMLSGQLPFAGETYQEVLAQRTLGKPRSLAELGVDVPPAVEQIIDHCLARNPDDRYATALELAQDLGDGQGTQVMLKRRVRRARFGLAASAAGLVALAVAFGAFWFSDRNREPVAGAEQAIAIQNTTTVAVLPFENATGRSDLAWLQTGIPELASDQLRESEDIQPVDTNRVLQTLADLNMIDRPGSSADIRQAAELMSAEIVVTGTIRGAGEAVRIDARVASLADAERGDGSFSVEVENENEVFELASRFAAALKKQLALPESADSNDAELSQSGPALQAYSEGIRQLYLGSSVEAVPLLERAVKEDPKFAAAWVRLSQAYEMLGYGERSVDAIQNASNLLSDKSNRVALEARAREATLTGDIQRAQRARQTIVERYPGDSEARVALALAYEDEGQLEKGMEVLRSVLASDPNHPRAWFLMGKYAILTGEIQAAIDEYLVRALVIQNRLGNQQGRADALNAMGIAYSRLGQLDQALEHYQQSAEIRARINDQRGVASSRTNIARILVAKGKFSEAREEFSQAMQSREAIGDRPGMAVLHNEIGLLEETRGRYIEALSRFRQALQIRRQLGDKRALTESYSNVGFAYFTLGEYDNAAVYWQQAMDTAIELDNQEDIVLARQNIGLLDFARGEWESALKQFLETLDEARQLDNPAIQAVSKGNLGRLAIYQGRFDAAERSLGDAAESLALLNEKRGETEYRLFAAELALLLGQAEQLENELEVIGELLGPDGNREQLATLHRLKGEQLLLAGEANQAADEFAVALQFAETSGNPIVILRTRLAESGIFPPGESEHQTRLLALLAEIESVGNVPLTLHILETMTGMFVSTADYQQGERYARRWLRAAQSVGIYEGSWRAHYLLAKSLSLQGKPEMAESSWQSANAEVARLKQNMNETQWQSFATLPAVMELTNGP
ncbi:MAG: protein kinase [Gammaproteobacteria bacterium]|nr:protein kinase [Gammaproteobacteria bacterium]